jgi:hypothetical protein
MFRVNRDVRLNTQGNQNYCTLPHAIEIEESQKCSNPTDSQLQKFWPNHKMVLFREGSVVGRHGISSGCL